MAGDRPTILAADLKQFPDAVDVVRVGSGRWTENHGEIVEALTDGVRRFLRKRKHMPIEQIIDEYGRHEPFASSGDSRVFLMYGRQNGLYLDDDSSLKLDIKGLVFAKP